MNFASIPLSPRAQDNSLAGNPFDRIGEHGRVNESRSDVASGSQEWSAGSSTTLNATEKRSEPISTDEDSNAIKIERQRQSEVAALARQYTIESQHNHLNPFDAEHDGPLDPDGQNFNARAWVRAFFDLQRSETDTHRTAGVAFQNLSVHGFGTDTDFQKTVGNIFLEAVSLGKQLLRTQRRRIQILQDIEGVVNDGEMLCVLGPPGSGCSTFLRTISGNTYGFYVDDKAYINYSGIPANRMHSAYRGEAVYTAEVDEHFPMLSVGDTLYFAALARAPQKVPGGVSRHVYATHLRDVIMTMLGISHTKNTRVGDNFVRGVSGGERKRVTIAEAALSYANIQCYDNSTRGLDSANAIEFCKTLRTQADIMGTTCAVSLYQAPQEAYNIFDKVLVLYEGRQIFFGHINHAQAYFEGLGFICPDRQTVPDFLTSMTSPIERVIRPGYEAKVPKTADDFAQAWRNSDYRGTVVAELDAYRQANPFQGQNAADFHSARRAQQSNMQRSKSPYTLSYMGQVKLCLWRAWRRLVGNPSIPIIMLITNLVQMLIVSSVFYNLPSDTNSLMKRAVLLFIVILVNAFGGILEILTLYEQRPMVDKHSRYALYHPSAEAFASMIMDMPYKITNAILSNILVYFMTNLRREPGPFFYFLLIAFSTTLTMSMLFRLIASASRTIEQALAPAAILLLIIALYTGFALPTQYMLGWISWIRYINPVSYGFESLMINEFVGRNFTCASFVPAGPGYDGALPVERTCPVVGAQAGSSVVEGLAYIVESYGYDPANKWRNFGILLAFVFGLMLLYLTLTELVTSKRSKGEVLKFKRGHVPKQIQQSSSPDVENQSTAQRKIEKSHSSEYQNINLQKQTAVFHWRNLCYDIETKDGTRRILDHVDGWVKPGTLTALMGVSGAGKTTLLDVLANRVTMGVVTGDIFVDGKARDDSFQRKTGYVQQQDLHLSTTTVREALTFSAVLRQPKSIPKRERIQYVDEVIDLLDMHEYADAIVGQLGEGLNVEQRKRLTIGVELAAKPELLLFLDEPTSGLDSQTSWSICNLMERLVNHGQAVLCTIHQPSAMLFQRFDRLLFLAKGGKTVYFGNIGRNSSTLIDYFVRNGADPCSEGANPAEWMLKVIGAAPGAKTNTDWHQVWRDSAEYESVRGELDRLEQAASQAPATGPKEDESHREFAASATEQLLMVSRRVFEQYWRTPSYIYSKALLTVGSIIFIGFSFFKAENTQRGLQNQMFGIFIFFTIFGSLVEQIVPIFVTQRTLYEARERPSKTYSWKAFLLANIMAELPWNTLMGILCFLCWWYPIGLYENAAYTNQEHSRAMLAVLFVWLFMMFASTFAFFVVAGAKNADIASNITNLIFIMMFIFCGVLAGPQALPGFWIFMYRVNPFTYLIEGMLTVGLANAPAYCAPNEFLNFQAPNASTCAQYMETYIATNGGYLSDPASSSTCNYCTYDNTNVFLSGVNADWGNRWRNFGIMFAYLAFNVAAAFALYWIFRVPRKHTGAKKRKT